MSHANLVSIPKEEALELVKRMRDSMYTVKFSQESINGILDHAQLSNHLREEIISNPLIILANESTLQQIANRLFLPHFKEWDNKPPGEILCYGLLLQSEVIQPSAQELLAFNAKAQPLNLDYWNYKNFDQYIEAARGDQNKINLLIHEVRRNKVSFFINLTDETREALRVLFDPAPVPTIEELHQECRDNQDKLWIGFFSELMNNSIKLFIQHNMEVISLEGLNPRFRFEGAFPAADAIATLQDNQARWCKEIA